MVSRNHGNTTTVYIGSHSGILLAIKLYTGRIQWRMQLPNRIESSCCISLCEQYIIIGN